MTNERDRSGAMARGMGQQLGLEQGQMTVLQSSVNWVIAQAKARLGDEYVYGGVYSPTDLSQGCDCSGVVGWVLEALTKPNDMSWAHVVSTESWYYDYANNTPAAPGTVGPFGTIAVASLADIPADAALTINIMHGGGGEDSHTNCVVPLPGSLPYEGVIIESNGDAGSCTNGTGAYLATADLWTDHWYLPGPWTFDVPPGQAPPVPAPGKTYTVVAGDDLSEIAEAHGLTLAALEAANPQIIDDEEIYIGQVINIP
jgi:LysM domain